MSRRLDNADALEADALAAARRHGCYCKKNNPPTRRDGAKLVYDKKGSKEPDFNACVDGRGILFDCKSVEGDKWAVSLLESHQAVSLDDHARSGGVSGLLIRFRSRGEAVDRWLPWADVRERFWGWWDAPPETRREAYVYPGEGVGLVGCDWVSVVRASA
jgi:hypothetical protein